MPITQYLINKLSTSFGILFELSEEKKYKFYHKCCTDYGSSRSPILNLKKKLIGIHKEGKKKFNMGTFLNSPIKELIQIYFQNNNENQINNIKIEVNINNNELLIKEFSQKYYNI